MNKILFIFLLIPLLSFSQKVDKLKVYLDCSWRCDDDFLQREMNYIETMKSYLRNKTYIKKTQQTNYSKVLMGIPIIGLITLVLFLIIFYPNNINWYIFFILNIIFLLLNSGFINFVGQTKGLVKAFGTMLICYLDIFLMLLGVIYGSFNYFFGRKY